MREGLGPWRGVPPIFPRPTHKEQAPPPTPGPSHPPAQPLPANDGPVAPVFFDIVHSKLVDLPAK